MTVCLCQHSCHVGGDEHAHVFAGGALRPPRAARGSLKEFVERFKDRHYHVIEMRIVLVCCVAVFFKLFLSNIIIEKDDQSLTYTALAFVGCKLLSILTSTYSSLLSSVCYGDYIQHLAGLLPFETSGRPAKVR